MHETVSEVDIDDPVDPSSTPTSIPAPRPAPSARATATPDPWRLHVLGPVELSYDGTIVEITGLARTLLALLARTPGVEVSTASIVSSVWDDDPPEDAESAIAAGISRLRKALTVVAPEVNPTGVVVTMPAGYVLAISPANVDSESFERHVTDGQRALAIGQPALALTRLERALASWRGTAYEDYGDQPFAQMEAHRLSERRLDAVEARVEAMLALAAPRVPSDLLEELQRLVSEYPHREGLWAQLMLVQYRLGHRGESLAVFREAELRLAHEFTAQPGTALRTLERAVLDNSAELSGAPPQRFALPSALKSADPACVGRDEEVAWLLAGLDMAATRRGQARLVVGSPGIGKTRVIVEVAQRAAERGVVVRYARADRGVSGALRVTPDLLNLLIVDDLDLASPEDLARVIEFVRALGDSPVFVLLSCRDHVRVGELSGLPKVVLTALADEAVADIVRVYAPNTSTPTAVSAMANAGGVPARLHRAASEWAFHRAGRRIDRAAASAPDTRRALEKIREEIIGGVADLEYVRVAARPLRPVVRDATVCPYKGLAPFEATDAPYFHGRRQAVAELVARMADLPLLALTGPRGSGKSSVLRAGLLPALAEGILPDSGHWRALLVTPSTATGLRERLAEVPEAPLPDPEPDVEPGSPDSPTTELPVLVVDGDEGESAPPYTVLVIDQFEQAYTVLDGDERSELLETVVAAARSGTVSVVLGLRSEFYPSVAAHPELADLVTANTVLLAPMTDDELWEAVVEPAAMVGISVELTLAETLVAVAPEPGLAALSLTMQRLWRVRDGHLLTLASYHSGPGLPNIIAATGEAALAELGSEETRAAAGSILANLATRSSDELLVARSMPTSELLALAGAGGADALRVLVNRELVTVTDGVAEIAHEELMVGWPRLRDWLDEASAQRNLRAHLRRSAAAWSGQTGEIYRGARLAAALDYAETHRDDLSGVELDFLNAGRRAILAEELRRRRRVVRLSRALVALSLVLAAAIAAGVLVFIAWRDATAANTRTDAARVGQAALGEPNLRRALLLAVAAARLDPGVTAPLEQVLGRSPNLVARAGDQVTAVAVSPDGGTVAAGTADGAVWLRRAGSLGDPVRLSYPEPVPVVGLAFSADARRLISWAGSADHATAAAIMVWDLARHAADGAAFGQAWPGPGGGLLADGSTLVLDQLNAAGGHAVVAWSLDSRTPSTAYDLPAGVRGDVLVSADGSVIAYATATGTAVVRIADRQQWDLPGVAHPSALNDDGTRLLAVQGHDVKVWDVAGGRAIGVVHAGADVKATAWAGDGHAFASVDQSGAILAWDADKLADTGTLSAAGSAVSALSFGPDGMLYSAGADGLVAWDLSGVRGVGSRLTRGMSSSELTGLACDLAGRELTEQEWSEFLPGQPYRHVCPA
jgi:DNA-binding SARP family transcriptional activator/WD40 repeat protein